MSQILGTSVRVAWLVFVMTLYVKVARLQMVVSVLLSSLLSDSELVVVSVRVQSVNSSFNA